MPGLIPRLTLLCCALILFSLTLLCRHFIFAYPAVRLFYFRLPCCALILFSLTQLLEGMQNVAEKQLGFGFIDDTNIITWSDSAQENCTRLEEAHKKCMDWSRRHGSKFAPDKYKLIHFTR